MWRYDLVNDARHLIIKKRWIAYFTDVLPTIGFCLLLTLFGLYGWLYPSHQGRGNPQLSLAIASVALTVMVGAISYKCWKILRGGDVFLFDARLHMFERNGHVISHWNGISMVQVVSVAHRRRRRRGMLWAIIDENESDYRYTYRAAVLLANGHVIVIDEYSDRIDIETLAREIAAYTVKPLDRDVLSTPLLG